MATNGVSSSAAKKYEDFNSDTLKNVKDAKKADKTIWDLNAAAANDVTEMEKDGITEGEKLHAIEWLNLIDNIVGNLSTDVKNKCTASLDNLLATVENLVHKILGDDSYVDGNNIGVDDEGAYLCEEDVAENEPQVTDAQKSNTPYKPKTNPQLDKEADAILAKKQKEHTDRLNHNNRWQVFGGIHDTNPIVSLSGKDIENIKQKYQVAITNEKGFRELGFYDYDRTLQLVAWADKKLRNDNIRQEDYAELTKDAKDALRKMTKKVNSDSNNTSEIAETADNDFWSQYSAIMTSEAHSHDGIADLESLPMGYTKEEAQNVLNQKNIARR